jgi:ABC-type multidrug transport system permease subunit
MESLRILVPPDTLPRFWIFLNRVSPLTYFIEGLASAVLANTLVSCSSIETLHINIPAGAGYHTCNEYLAAYSSVSGGYVVNPGDSLDCQFCPVANANSVLKTFGAVTGRPWVDVGVMGANIAFNVLATFGVYWLARVPWNGRKVAAQVDVVDRSPPSPKSAM